jgi:hypothetical protein
MRIGRKIAKWLAGLAVAALIGLAVWLYFAPPAMIRVAAGYSAKIVCSNVFIAGRDAPMCCRPMCKRRGIRS